MDKKKFLNLFAFMLGQELETQSPKDTGTMARSFKLYTIKNNEINFKAPFYTEYVEFGSPPHEIKPKNAKALVFAKKGFRRGINKGKVYSAEVKGGIITDRQNAIFAKKVMHPGNKPNPFIRHTINTKTKEILQKAIKLSK